MSEPFEPQLAPLPAPPVVAWDGRWNLDNDAEMLVMLRGLMVAHRPALLKVGDDWQMGWKGRKREVWGLRLPCPKRAIRDASGRLFLMIKGREMVNGDPPPPLTLADYQAAELHTLAAIQNQQSKI